jgi:hypothetical protein
MWCASCLVAALSTQCILLLDWVSLLATSSSLTCPEGIPYHPCVFFDFCCAFYKLCLVDVQYS